MPCWCLIKTLAETLSPMCCSTSTFQKRRTVVHLNEWDFVLCTVWILGNATKQYWLWVRCWLWIVCSQAWRCTCLPRFSDYQSFGRDVCNLDFNPEIPSSLKPNRSPLILARVQMNQNCFLCVLVIRNESVHFKWADLHHCSTLPL